MPINKNAYLRYQVLDKCFANFHKKYYWEHLLEEVNQVLAENNGSNSGIGRTQLFKDISFMESEAGFSIELGNYKEGRKKYYRYTNKDFTIKQSPLSSNESDSIKSAIVVLSRFKGLPQFEWLNELIPVLSDKLDIHKVQKEAIIFDANIDYTGTQYIEPIFNAIHNQSVLRIQYQDFKNDFAYPIELHPYILKEYNNRWFVFGFNEFKQSYHWNLALDRIHGIETMAGKVYQPYSIDWEEDYFYDLIGVTRKVEEQLTTVVLQVDASLIPYIRTKPIHPSQTEKTTDNISGAVTLSIEVIPNYELERLLLSFGEKIKILSPEPLQKKLKERVKACLKQYNNSLEP